MYNDNKKRKEAKERKITSATGTENRTMYQLIFNPNKYYLINIDKIVIIITVVVVIIKKTIFVSLYGRFVKVGTPHSLCTHVMPKRKLIPVNSSPSFKYY